MTRAAQLRALLAAPGIHVAPGVYDGMSTRFAAGHGFPLLYLSGGGSAASVLGEPDIGLLDLELMLGQVRRISSVIDVPLIADADTGFGGPRNVIRTVRQYEKAGAAGLHIEDQVFPKRCGHLDGKEVVAIPEFVTKLEAAVAYRHDPDFVIIARTDAREPLGLDAAIERAVAYKAAGADVIFVEAPRSREEIERIAREVEGPLLINVVMRGRTPAVPLDELAALGYKVAIFPSVASRPAAAAIAQSMRTLAETGGYGETTGMTPLEYFTSLGLDWWSQVDGALTQDAVP